MKKEEEAVKAIDKVPNDVEVVNELRRSAKEAAATLAQLLTKGLSENVRLAAARDILDRSGYKPVERKDVTSGGMPINTAPMISDDQLKDVINGFLKRTAIDVPGRESNSSEGSF